MRPSALFGLNQPFSDHLLSCVEGNERLILLDIVFDPLKNSNDAQNGPCTQESCKYRAFDLDCHSGSTLFDVFYS